MLPLIPLLNEKSRAIRPSRFEMEDGIGPCSVLQERFSKCIFFNSPKSGILFAKRLCARFRLSKFVILKIFSLMGPLRALSSRLNSLKLCMLPIDSGSIP